jgi:hypothetical protein
MFKVDIIYNNYARLVLVGVRAKSARATSRSPAPLLRPMCDSYVLGASEDQTLVFANDA